MDADRRRRTLRIAALAVLGLGVLAFVVSLQEIFAPLLFALLLAYILNPVVNWIQRARIARAPAIGLLFLVFYGLLIGTGVATVPAFFRQLGDLYEASVGDTGAASREALAEPAADRGLDVLPVEPPWEGRVAWYLDENGNGEFDPGYVREAGVWAGALLERVQRKEPKAVEQGLEAVRARLVEGSASAVDSALKAVFDLIYSVFGFLTLFILIPIYLFYFLMGLSSLRDRVFEHLPGQYRDRIIDILTKIDVAVSAFFRGRLIIMVLKGILTAVALVFVGVPFALVIGVLTGVGSLIPIAGFLIGMIPGVAIAFLDGGSLLTALLVAGIFCVIEVFENYFLTPWILQDRVGLHPITLVVSVFVGGALFGFVGMLLAVPMTSVAKILFQEFVLPEIRALAAEEPT